MVNLNSRNIQLGFSLSVFLIILYRFLNIAFLNFGQGILSPTFTQVYYYVLLAAVIVIGFFLIVDFTKYIPRSSPISFGFIFEDNRLRPFGKPGTKLWIRVLPHVALALFFAFSAIGLKSALIPVPDAFNQESLSEVNEFDKITYQSIDPGFGEEAIIFGIVSMLVMVFTFVFTRILGLRETLSYYLSTFLSCGIGSYIFMIGHNVSYGLNESAKMSAFVFEFTCQMANQLTGIFMSWLPHVSHNFIVMAFAFTITLSIGAEIFSAFPLWRIKNEKSST